MKVGGIYVDISNAFPSVDHSILLDKLRTAGNLGLSNEWFASYHSGRNMFVDVNETRSIEMPISRGVPQGSLFGPSLFNLYYDDVVSKFNSNDVTLFADDTAVISSSANTSSLLKQLQSELTKIDAHLTSLRMELNAKKTYLCCLGMIVTFR